MSRPAERVSLALVGASLAAGLLPPLSVKAEELDEPALRRGEWVGCALALAVGISASIMAEDPLPLIATVVILAGMVASYEHALRSRPDNAADAAG